MRIRKPVVISILTGILLLTACAGSVDTGPTSTPDPALMSIKERTIWDFENYRNEIRELAAEAAETPAEDLPAIIQQMGMLNGEIMGYEFPLYASQAHSALLNIATRTEQCYFGKYAEYMAETSDQEMMGAYDDHCDQIQVFEETFDLYIQELKDPNAEE